MKIKLFVSAVVISFIFSCQPHVKPTKISKAPPIRVLLAQFQQPDSLEFNGSYILKLEEARYQLGLRQPKFYISLSKTGFKLYNANRLFVFNKNTVVNLLPQQPAKSRFQFRNKWYKGKIIFQLDKQNNILLINEIDLEEYLKSVLVGEMPANNKAYLEALKAQAICARTYALRRMKQKANKPFHVYADVRDQVYASLTKRTKLADQAVEATRGVALMYNNQLAKIYFHSTCGGILEDIQNYWPSKNPIPYLSSRKDVLGSHFACQPSPYFRWQKSFSFEQIDSLFHKKFGKSLLKTAPSDTLLAQCQFQILKRTSSGRVKSMKITYADTSVILNNFSIRSFFSDSLKKGLPSLLFTIQAHNDSTILIKGAGYGHGIGLCQWGALNMSQMGFKYYDILVNQYFPGTYLKEIY